VRVSLKTRATPAVPCRDYFTPWHYIISEHEGYTGSPSDYFTLWHYIISEHEGYTGSPSDYFTPTAAHYMYVSE